MKGRLLKDYVKRIADLEFALKVLVAESECYCTDNVAMDGTCAWCHAYVVLGLGVHPDAQKAGKGKA